MQAIAEVGIQIIAVSQVSSALELGFYLEDIRNDRSTQARILIANPGRRTTTTLNRKLRINSFFWIHVGVLVLLLLSFMVTGAILIDLD